MTQVRFKEHRVGKGATDHAASEAHKSPIKSQLDL